MIALLTAALAAPALESGNTAHTLSQADSKVTFGVFRPVAIRLNERTDLVTTGVIGSLLAPRVDLKLRTVEQDDENPVTTSLVFGLNSPTPVANLAKGWLYGSEDRLPFALQAKVGILASRQMQRFRLTLGAELRAGLAFGANDYSPRDLWFYDWNTAPLSEGPVAAHLKVQGDLAPTDGLLFTVELHLQSTDVSTELASRWFVLGALSEHVALGAGYFTHLDRRAGGVEHYLVPGADLQVRF